MLGAYMPAASMGADEFVKAAQKYGLRTDNETLNWIVALVNSGMTVEQAAERVSKK